MGNSVQSRTNSLICFFKKKVLTILNNFEVFFNQNKGKSRLLSRKIISRGKYNLGRIRCSVRISSLSLFTLYRQYNTKLEIFYWNCGNDKYRKELKCSA
jgi:hypothetical protein